MEGFSKTIVLKTRHDGQYRVLIPNEQSEAFFIYLVEVYPDHVRGFECVQATVLVPRLAVEPGDVHLRMAACPKILQKAVARMRLRPKKV